MRFDVTIGFYRQETAWPMVVEGLRRNREYISSVIVVNDEPWGEWRPEIDDIPLLLLDHEHDGRGTPKNINQGFKASCTEHTVYIDADMFLPRGAIAKALPGTGPNRLVFSRMHGVDPKDFDPDNPKFTAVDDRIQAGIGSHPHWIARTGFFIAHRRAFLQMGGWDENYKTYGYEEYEFTLRWMYTYGLNSVILSPSESWHMGGEEIHDMSRRAQAGSYEVETFHKAYRNLMEKLHR